MWACLAQVQTFPLQYNNLFLFFFSEEDAAVVYQNASHLKMTGEGFVWLVTQQSFSGTARSVLPQGEIIIH